MSQIQAIDRETQVHTGIVPKNVDISNSSPPTWNQLLPLICSESLGVFLFRVTEDKNSIICVFVMSPWHHKPQSSLETASPHAPLYPLPSQAYPARAAASGVSHPPQHQPQRRRLLPEQPDGVHQGRRHWKARKEVSAVFLFREVTGQQII